MHLGCTMTGYATKPPLDGPSACNDARQDVGEGDAWESADLKAFKQAIEMATAIVAEGLRGHGAVSRLVFAAMVAKGHVLLEDVPGVGKTTLARSLAQILGSPLSRIQFTADMLPSDVLGSQMLVPKSGELRFRAGPIFAPLVLADEINRASPKTQSALLQAMAERCVTLDGEEHVLPKPFLVVATQNPSEHHGTYPLPESQLDRFAVLTSIGYPSAEDEKAILMDASGGAEQRIQTLPQALPMQTMLAAQAYLAHVRIGDSVAGYMHAWVQATRDHDEVLLGCSPRGALVLARMCRAWALLDGRSYVTPDDVKAMAEPVLAHRMTLAAAIRPQEARSHAVSLLQQMAQQIPVPR